MVRVANGGPVDQQTRAAIPWIARHPRRRVEQLANRRNEVPNREGPARKHRARRTPVTLLIACSILLATFIVTAFSRPNRWQFFTPPILRDTLCCSGKPGLI